MKSRLYCLPALLLVFAATSLHAQSFLTPNFSGTTSYDGWAGLNQGTYNPGYGTYPGSAAWPSPIDSNTVSSGDALLDKISGNGYLASGGANSYIYSPRSGAGAASTDASFVVGTFSIYDDTPVANLANVLFQLQIESWSGVAVPFPTGTSPILSYNGGSQNLTATYSALLGSYPVTGAMGTSSADTLAFQWDLSGIVDPITSFAITYSTTNHAQTHEVQLDQSDTYVQAVPEPAAGVVLMGGMGMLLMLRRRTARAI